MVPYPFETRLYEHHIPGRRSRSRKWHQRGYGVGKYYTIFPLLSQRSVVKAGQAVHDLQDELCFLLEVVGHGLLGR
jgi:hypothetical protein